MGLLEHDDVGLRQVAAGLAEQCGDERTAAYPDLPVDTPHGQVDVKAGQRRAPADHVPKAPDSENARPVRVSGGS